MGKVCEGCRPDDSEMNNGPKRDWVKTQVHFACGIILGVLISWSMGGGRLEICATGLVVGILAAIFLDRFWESLLEWWR